MRWRVNSSAVALVLVLAASLGPVARVVLSAQTRPSESLRSISPFVDVHTHLDPADPEGSVQAALRAMGVDNAARILFLPPPFPPDDYARYDAETILPAVKKHADKLAALGGGGSLNAMIQESVKSDDAGSAVQQKFKNRAEELLREGVVGFGEMTAEHLPAGIGYQYAPPDHPLFLLLADVAAKGGVPIDLHMEAVPRDMALPTDLKSPPNPPRLHANIAAFERLLAHNPRANIVWAHLGSDNTGERTPDLCRRLLQAHPNLYMEIKIDPRSVGKNSLLANGASGRIRPEWLKLFQEFPDRFVAGTDQHYPEPNTIPQRWQAVVLLLNQLPDDLRPKIAIENALRLYFPQK